MDLSLRVRLSVMMFLQYFVWGSWGVVIFGYVSKLPTEGGLNFPGGDVGWIGSTLPIGAMISPIFVGLFADRLFSSEKVLAILHLLGGGLLVWAAYTCDQGFPRIREAFEAAAKAEKVGDGNLLNALAKEKQLQDQVKNAQGEEAAELAKKLNAFQEDQLKAALKRVNESAEVTHAVENTFTPLVSILLAYALCFMPTIMLSNSLSFRNLSDPDKYFGGIRLLGTIGWIIANWIVGFALNAISSQPIYLAAAGSIMLGLFCFALPHTPPSGGAKTLGDSLGLPALAMLKNPSFLVFFVCSFLITIVLAFYYQQAFPFLVAIEVPNPAVVLTLGQILESFFMLAIPVGLLWLGTKGMLVVGMLAWCLRYAIFASQNVPAVVGLGVPLHGICYDFFFVVSYLYVDRKAPQHLRASAQGLISFVTLGLGMFLGNKLAGAVVEKFKLGSGVDWTQVWLVPLAGSLAATVLFFLLFKEGKGDTGQATVSKSLEGLDPAAPPEQSH